MRMRKKLVIAAGAVGGLATFDNRVPLATGMLTSTSKPTAIGAGVGADGNDVSAATSGATHRIEVDRKSVV